MVFKFLVSKKAVYKPIFLSVIILSVLVLSFIPFISSTLSIITGETSDGYIYGENESSCSGTPNVCADYDFSEGQCLGQSGCVWDAPSDCGGTPDPCSDFDDDESNCDGHGGCSWDAPNYEAARDTSDIYSITAVPVYVGHDYASYEFKLYRGYLDFNTSSIPDDATVTDVKLSLKFYYDGSATDFDVQIYKFTWAEPIAGGNREANYDASGTVYDALWRNTNGLSSGTYYNSSSLNNSWVNLTGDTKYQLRSKEDVDNSEPTNDEYISVHSADSLGNQPILYITYILNTAPNVLIISPTNTTYATTTIGFNLTVVDNTVVDTCLYSLDLGSNITMSNDTASNFYATNLTMTQGAHTVYYYCNDTTNLVNGSEQVTFTVDTTYPLISYDSSSDSSGNHSKSDIFINITASDTNKDTIQWEFDGTNETFASSSGNYYWENKTGLADGTYSFYAWINDSAGNFNSTATRTITLDTINPDISIAYPSNNTFTTNTILNINYTVSDTNHLDSCWYSNDSMTLNTSIACGTNITTITWVEGQHNVTIWANDSANNVNSSSVTFTVDTTYPLISYSGGTETDFKNVSQSNVYVNVSVTETNEANITFYLFNSDSSLNTSTTYTDKTHHINWTGLSDGFYYYNVTIIDDASNSNSTATRKIGLDNVAPALILVHPKAQSYSTNVSLELNYSVSDVLLEVSSCWYRIVNSTGDIITSNTTITGCANTTFNVSQGEGTYNLTLYANDTINHVNSSIVTFGISITAPSIVLDYPTDDLWFNSGQNIYFNFTATDSDGLDTCELWGNWTGTWHKNYTWTAPTNATQNYTILNLTDVEAIWNVWCNDTNNLENWALNNFTFGVDTVYPEIGINYINTIQNSKTITFNTSANDTNTLTCKYSIFYTNGSLDGVNENISFTCGAESLATVRGDYGIYNLTVYAIDPASNENSSTRKFTIAQSPPGSGGGGPEAEVDEEEEEIEEFIAKGICGNGLCEPGESFYNCPEDCGGLNIDDLILSCFSDDPVEKSKCIINQSPVLFFLGIGVMGFTFITILLRTDVGKKYQKKIYAYADYQPKRRFRRKSWLKKYVR